MSMPTTSSHKVPKSTAPAPSGKTSHHTAESKRIGHHGPTSEPTNKAMDAEDYQELTHGKKPSAAEERREAKVGH